MYKIHKLCKEIELPIPPSGYWTKLSFGKPVEQIPLPESQLSEVILPTNATPKHLKHFSSSESMSEMKAEKSQSEIIDDKIEAIVQNEGIKEQSEVEIIDGNDTQLAFRTVSGERNVYNREKLYEEVLSKSVVQVALQYGVSDVAIHKVCKSLNVPVPPRGYWARIRAGEKIKKPRLPVAKGITEKTGSKTFEGIKVENAMQQTLAFLTEDERQKVLLAAEQL